MNRRLAGEDDNGSFDRRPLSNNRSTSQEKQMNTSINTPLRGILIGDYIRGVVLGDYCRGVVLGDYCRGIILGDYTRGVVLGD
jgi:hypothetical protein